MAPGNKSDKKKKENQKVEDKKNDNALLCCVPQEKVYCAKPDLAELNNVKVNCSSSKCTLSGFMHTECFEKFEEIICGFLSKTGRGRTWSEKQRFANVWTNKGYDLVFKTCACDCGHGSLRKDLEYVPPTPVVGGAVGRAGSEEKKKKKEKTTLKPKLNFSCQQVSGSYYGSLKNQLYEEQDEEIHPIREACVGRVGVRRISDKSDTPPPLMVIPGISTTPPPHPDCTYSSHLTPNSNITVPCSLTGLSSPAPPVISTTSYNTSIQLESDTLRYVSGHNNATKDLSGHNATKELSGHNAAKDLFGQTNATKNFCSFNNTTTKDDGWVKVGVNRRNSMLNVKTKRNSSMDNNLKPDILAREKTPTDLLKIVSQLDSNTPQPVSPHTNVSPHLPMFQSPMVDKSFYIDNPPPNYPNHLGARPKENSPPIKTEVVDQDDIYLSDEELYFHEIDNNLTKLVEVSPVLTPKWEMSPPKSPAANPEEEMNILWEQTANFEQEIMKTESRRESSVSNVGKSTGVTNGGSQDTNDYIHCSSCNILSVTSVDYDAHCRTENHMKYTAWAENMDKIQVDSVDKLVGGWQNPLWEEDRKELLRRQVEKELIEKVNSLAKSNNTIAKSNNTIEDQSKKNPEINISMKSENSLKDVMQVELPVGDISSPVNVANEIEKLREELIKERAAKNMAIDNLSLLEDELEAQKKAKNRALEELNAFKLKKKNLEKQLQIMSNTLEVEEDKVRKLESIVEVMEAALGSKNDELKEKVGSLENSLSLLEEVNTLRETVVNEQNKNEISKKVNKKINEKWEATLQNEKELRAVTENSLQTMEQMLLNEQKQSQILSEELTEALARANRLEEHVEGYLSNISTVNIYLEKEITEKKCSASVSKDYLNDTPDLKENVTDNTQVQETLLTESEGDQLNILVKENCPIYENIEKRLDVDSSQALVEECLQTAFAQIGLKQNSSNLEDVSTLVTNVACKLDIEGNEVGEHAKDDAKCEISTWHIVNVDGNRDHSESNKPHHSKEFKSLSNQLEETQTEEGIVDDTNLFMELLRETREKKVQAMLPSHKPIKLSCNFEEVCNGDTHDIDTIDTLSGCNSSEKNCSVNRTAEILDPIEFENEKVLLVESGNEINSNIIPPDFEEVNIKIDSSIEKCELLETIAEKGSRLLSNDAEQFINEDWIIEDAIEADVSEVNDKVDDLSYIEECVDIDSELENNEKISNMSVVNIDQHLQHSKMDGNYEKPDIRVIGISFNDDQPIIEDINLDESSDNTQDVESSDEPTTLPKNIHNEIVPCNIQTEVVTEGTAEESIYNSEEQNESCKENMSEGSSQCSGWAFDQVNDLERHPLHDGSKVEGTLIKLTHLVTVLGRQVETLTNKLEDADFKNGLLEQTVARMQDKNTKLENKVEALQQKTVKLENGLFSQNDTNVDKINRSDVSDEVSVMRENLLQLLSSCETFQTGFDGMSIKQVDMDNQFKELSNDMTEIKGENEDVIDQFAKLSDKFNSLHLEYQVDKGNTQAQLDNLGYNVAILTSKIPVSSFTSTSGVRSGSEDNSKLSDVACSSVPPPEPVKDIVSSLVFPNDISGTESGEKVNTLESVSGNKKKIPKRSLSPRMVFSKTTVSQPSTTFPPPPANLWLSPDGNLMAIQPNMFGTYPPPPCLSPTPARNRVGQLPFPPSHLYPYPYPFLNR